MLYIPNAISLLYFISKMIDPPLDGGRSKVVLRVKLNLMISIKKTTEKH